MSIFEYIDFFKKGPKKWKNRLFSKKLKIYKNRSRPFLIIFWELSEKIEKNFFFENFGHILTYLVFFKKCKTLTPLLTPHFFSKFYFCSISYCRALISLQNALLMINFGWVFFDEHSFFERGIFLGEISLRNAQSK